MNHDRTVRARRKLVDDLPVTAELLRGSLLERVVRHKSGCTSCARGEGHSVSVLTVSYPGGRTRQLSVRRERVAEVRRWLDNYQRLKEAIEAMRLVTLLAGPAGTVWDLSHIQSAAANSDDPHPYHMFCHLAAYCGAAVLGEIGVKVEMATGVYENCGLQHNRHSWLELPTGDVIDIHPEGIGLYSVDNVALFVPRSRRHNYRSNAQLKTDVLAILLKKDTAHERAVAYVLATMRSRLSSPIRI